MAGTFHQIYIQIVFRVRNRDRIIPQNKKTSFHKYITGVVQNNKCKMICINSVPDHIHLLVGLHPTICTSDLVKDIKLASSDVIKLV
ncbi:transposase IS200 like protein [bacterium BMS3Abin03]|nr:transposase IS200 like protein [bacterium BMS3Abin03]